MSQRRRPGEPGAARPSMENTCGYDAGITGGPRCGKPATWHLTIGSPDTGPADWAAMSCDEHANPVMAHSWDWHQVSAVCDVPGSMWQPGQYQGEGFCFWPEAEAAMHEIASERPRIFATPATPTSHTSLT